MSPRVRELAACALWVLAALAWVVAMLVPWYDAGVAASTTPVEVAGLLRTGALGVPPVAGYAVVLLAAPALVLVGLAPLRGPVVMGLRVLLWLLGTAAGLVLVVVLGRLSSYAVGPGAALVVLGCALGGAALGLATVRRPGGPTRTGSAGPRGAG